MYFRILKKDLKRKKTMNIILLLFILLASMFVASSVNNILSISGGLDYYFEKAGMPDYFVAVIDKAQGTDVSEVLDELDMVESYGVEEILYLIAENTIHEGEEIKTKNTTILTAFEDCELNLFDENNQVISSLLPGQILVSMGCMKQHDIKTGDTITVAFGTVTKELVVAGGFKDAIFGSEMMGNTRYVISEEDFEEYFVEGEAGFNRGSLYYIQTEDTETLEQTLAELDSGIITNVPQKTIRMSYVMNLVIAGVLLVISILLILISFVVLRFTISFTLSEEFREIGVMKAIGLGNTKIRGLYMTKYFMLAVAGAAAGFVASIPFGAMLVRSVSETMVLGAEGGLWINAVCSLMVVLLILWFCFGCTAKVKKFTPVDAIRSGTTGERFQKKGVLRLHKSGSRPALFLAINDVLGSPKRYGTVILTFTLCLSMLQILVTTVHTLKSGSLISAFGISESDVYYSNDARQMSFLVENGRELVRQELADMEEFLAEQGMPAKCCSEVMLTKTLVHGDNVCKVPVYQGIGTTMDRYTYFEGTAPQNEKELALTPQTAENLGAAIGDTVIIRHSFGEREYMVTALFQSMNNLGEGVRLHEDTEVDFKKTSGFFAFQIDFLDDPPEEVIEERIGRLKDLYNSEQVYSAGEYVERMVGVAETVDSVRVLMQIVIGVIIVLITVLMERSFLAKERGEIAILKAIGFRNRTIRQWHTIRFGITGVVAAVLSMPLLYPLTVLLIGPVFDMMGADFGITYEIVPLEVFVLYPLFVLAVTTVSAAITTVHIKKITASEASGME
ncbi:MAG: ABC transporter permease [Lachnospiraceae bacterium]|nr:ABC transporter permease [Lachnospiraceae bacterium]